ncbi:DUF7693 family protein [Pseudomonas sp. HLT2-19-2]
MRVSLFNDSDNLDYCEDCRSPDGRAGSLETWQRYGRSNRDSSSLVHIPVCFPHRGYWLLRMSYHSLTVFFFRRRLCIDW